MDFRHHDPARDISEGGAQPLTTRRRAQPTGPATGGILDNLGKV
jgi:hypothetical protein